MFISISDWLKRIISVATRAIFRTAIKIIKSNKSVYELVYDSANSQEFSDLYEHEKMLADKVRIDTYATGIKRLIKKADVVVDLGTGSGILAIFAARQGAKVYAIDHSKFISVAKKIANLNGVYNITFIKTHSKNFVPKEEIDIILHEQIGDDLFNENMVDNLLELKRRLLRRGGKIVPGRFHLYMEPISLYPEFRVPEFEEICIDGIEFSRAAKEAQEYKSRKYSRRFVEPGGVSYFFGERSPIVTIDLNEIDDVFGFPLVFNASRQALRPGVLDGIYQYFEVVFDEDIRFDTSPLSSRTHWTNRLFRLPQREVATGETIEYVLEMEEIRRTDSWSVSLKSVRQNVLAATGA
jgi:protein arginine N-methyltransferase 1